MRTTPYSLTFTLGEADLPLIWRSAWEFSSVWGSNKREAAHRRNVYLVWVLIGVGIAALSFGSSVGAGLWQQGSIFGTGLTLAVIFGKSAILLSSSAYIERYKTAYLKQLRAPEILGMFMPRVVEIGPAGVRDASSGRVLQYPWPSVLSVDDAGDFVRLGTQVHEALIIPSRAFLDDAEHQQFVVDAREWLASATNPIA